MPGTNHLSSTSNPETWRRATPHPATLLLLFHVLTKAPSETLLPTLKYAHVAAAAVTQTSGALACVLLRRPAGLLRVLLRRLAGLLHFCCCADQLGSRVRNALTEQKASRMATYTSPFAGNATICVQTLRISPELITTKQFNYRQVKKVAGGKVGGGEEGCSFFATKQFSYRQEKNFQGLMFNDHKADQVQAIQRLLLVSTSDG